MRVRWTTDAADDLERICDYIAERHPEAARRVAQTVVEGMGTLESFPNLLQPRLDAGDESAWTCAVEVFERRIRERFLSCLEVLMKADSKLDEAVPSAPSPDCSTLPDNQGKQVVVPGFAILALCCLLAETLQKFRGKPAKPIASAGQCTFPDDGKCIKPTTTDQFREFLKRPAFRGAFDDPKVARCFVRGVRNGIFHEAETRRWLIW